MRRKEPKDEEDPETEQYTLFSRYIRIDVLPVVMQSTTGTLDTNREVTNSVSPTGYGPFPQLKAILISSFTHSHISHLSS